MIFDHNISSGVSFRVPLLSAAIPVIICCFIATDGLCQGGGSISGSPWQGCPLYTNGSYTFNFSESQAGGILCSQPSWTLSPSNAGDITPNNMSASVTWSASGNIRVDYCVFVYATQQVESRYVQQYFTMNVNANAGTISSTGPTTICTGGSANFTVTGNNGSVVWQKCTSGCGVGNDTGWSTTTSSNSNLTTTTQFRAKLTNTCGTSYSNVIPITVNQPPTSANAGSDQTSSLTCGLTSVTLAGNSPSVGTGSWSVVSGSGGSFGNSSSPTSTFSGAAGSTYVLRWTISNSPCSSSSDDVTVAFNRNPTASNAGPDQTGSSTCGLTSVTLSGNSPSVGTGLWSIVSGTGGVIGTPSNRTSTFSGTAGSTYVLRWTIANSPCTSSTDDVTIKFNVNPTVGNAGADQTGAATCGLTSVTLAGNVPSIGTGSWSIVSGSGGSFGNSSSPASSFSGSAGSTYIVRWTIANSPCVSSDDATITFNSASNGGTVGPAASAYGVTAGQLTLTSHAGTIQKWQKKVGSGSWADITNTTATLSYSNVTATTSYRVEVKNGICAVAYSNEVVITIYPIPSLAIQGSNTLSPGGSTTLVTDPGLYSYEWFKNDVTIAGQTTDQLTVTKPATYKLKVRATSTAPFYTTGNVVIGEAIASQATPVNYILTTTFQNEGITAQTDLYDLQPSDLAQVIQYFDGLGRPVQGVSIGNSPARKDVVQPIAYDIFGREELKYLPYARNAHSGSYVSSALTDQASFYQTAANVAHDSDPYQRSIFEPSPVNRVLKQAAPGTAWQPDANPYATTTDHTVKYDYGANDATEVLKWNYLVPNSTYTLGRVNAATSGTPNKYAANTLFKNKTKDENQNEVITFTDKLGRTILKRVQAPSAAWADTYYIYNDGGDLVTVIPPEAVKLINATASAYHTANDATRETFLNLWAFRYRYDNRHRMIMKKVPGSGIVYMVYDNRDRLVMTQDDNQRHISPTKEWTFTKYDFLNRPVLTGKYLSNNDQAAMQTAVDNYYAVISTGEAWFETYSGSTATVLGYSNSSFPSVSASADYYTVNYYDTYDSYIAPAGYTYLNESLPGQETSSFQRVNGQVTGTLIKNLSSGTFLRTVKYYDDRYRVIQTIGDHHAGTVRTSNVYDFAGKVLISKRAYVVNSATKTIKETYAYDHAGRLLTVKHSVDGAADVMIVRNEYNELGQLIDKKLHSEDNGATFKQSVDHRYNIRGWLTKINEADVSAVASGDTGYDYFGMELSYDNAVSGLTTTQMFNGNISAMQWSKGNGGSVGRQAYSFQYDPMNRLTTASHFDHDVSWQSYNRTYQEKINSYDLNGNIQNLSRRGFGGALMDTLRYFYSGNRLSYVHDNGNQTEGFVNANTGTDDYDYDWNGNLDKDKNKGISTKGNIKYNYLNLPKDIIKGTESIKYIYDASGRKLRQEVYSNNGGTLVKYTDYIGELVYEGGNLQFIQHAEGRVLPDGGGWEYQYHLKDHLGNVRVTFTAKPQMPVNYTANLENGNGSSGEGVFGNYTSTTFDLVDHTDPGTTYQRVQWLNGGASGRVGLTKSLSVMPGDRVSVTAYAKYRNLTGTGNANPFAAALTAAFGVSSGSTGEQLKLYNSLNAYGVSVAGGNHPADDDTAPKAFVTILLFDKNYNLLDAAWDQVTTTLEQVSATNKEAFDHALSKEVIVQEAGYAYIFVSNEHPTYVDVYFDDVTVGHTLSPIVSSSDYYPFGLTFNSYHRETALPNQYQHNGKEKQDELEIGWLDFGLRMYQPELGRWNSIDPLAETYGNIGPYTYVANNPIALVDPNGAEIWLSYRTKNENDEEVTTRVKYSDGKLYTEDGDEYQERGGTADVLNLVRDQLNSIKELAGDNEEIKGIFATLEGTSNDHDIDIDLRPYNPDGRTPEERNENQNKLNHPFWSLFGFDGTTTNYNPLNETEPENGERRDPRIALAHELRHAYDREVDTYEWTSGGKSIKTGTYIPVSTFEFSAVNTENVLRLKLYGERKTTYMGVKIPAQYLTNE